MKESKYLANNYSNLYETDFYKKELKFLGSDEAALHKFECLAALANALYTESSQHIGFTSKKPENALMCSVGESKIIKGILREHPEAIEVLRDAAGIDRKYHPSTKLTALDAAVNICKEHLEMVKSEDKNKDKEQEGRDR